MLVATNDEERSLRRLRINFIAPFTLESTK